LTLSESQIRARMVHLHDQEMSAPLAWYWLSFADDDGFRGVAIVQARGVTTAIAKTHHLKINPGGQVMCIEIQPEHVPAPEYRERLLSREQLAEAGLA